MLRLAFCFLLVTACGMTAARGEITWSGDVDPSDPTTWTSETNAFIGRTSQGTLSVAEASNLASSDAVIGADSDSFGEVAIDGADSAWTISRSLRVGRNGEGLLTISNEAVVAVSHDTWVGQEANSVGQIHFDGGQLSTKGLYAGVASLTGTGVIYARSLITDLDLVFDATRGLNQVIHLNSEPGQDITIHLNASGYHPMGAGYVGTGSLTITDGKSLNATERRIGYLASANGTVTVDGSGSVWRGTGMAVGVYGSGTLRVRNGGYVESAGGTLGFLPGSSGEVLVDGVGSRWEDFSGVRIGAAGNGALTISSGGEVVSRGADVGYSAEAIGSAVVTGANSHWNVVRDLVVGRQGDGRLLISDGGTVRALAGYIGAQAGSVGEVIVDGEGSQWNVVTSAGLYVGQSGSGSLAVTNGGSVNISISHSCYIGSGGGSKGDVTIKGSGSLLTSSSGIFVGGQGEGMMRVLEGASATSNTGIVASISGNAAQATVDGSSSKWNIMGQLIVGGIRGDGALLITNGGYIESGNASIGTAEGDAVEVRVDGVDSWWANRGPLSIGGNGSSSLSITNGGLVSVEGNLSISANSGSVVRRVDLSTGGQLALYGNVEDSLTQFLGLVQGTDAIRYWSADLDDWTPITYATYGIDYTLEYLTTGDLAGFTVLTVGTVPSPVAGDFNGDGIVNLADYTLWRDNLGAADDSAIANAGDGVPGVDAGDYATWKTQFGEQQDSSSITGITAVPEPTALVMVAGVLVMALRYVDRRPRGA